MTIIAEITVNSTQGQYTYQILRTDPELETHYTIVMLTPEPKDIAEADSFDQAIQEITNNLFYNEVDL